MYLAPLNYDRFFKKVFSHVHIAKAFLEDFLDTEIEEIEKLDTEHFLTNEAAKLTFDFRCKIKGSDIIVEMQQWYKPDVIKRFYLYHCTATTLQLERLPEKKLPISTEDSRAKSRDYRLLTPVLTLIWMVNDNLGYKENFIAYTILPEAIKEFLEDKDIWANPQIKNIVKERESILKKLNKKEKELDFLPQNRLIFMFQNNIVLDTAFAKYHRWFDFAAKTLNPDNEKEDFEVYQSEKLFKEIMLLINKKKLEKNDLDYIETEEEHIEMVNRTLEGEFIKGKQEGYWEGKEMGMIEGKEVGIIEGKRKNNIEITIRLYKKGKKIEEIADLLDIPINEIEQIIQTIN